MAIAQVSEFVTVLNVHLTNGDWGRSQGKEEVFILELVISKRPGE